MTVGDRYELMKQSDACFSCLSPSHLLYDCKDKGKCIHGCGKYHHETLHVDKSDTTRTFDVKTINADLDSAYNLCLFPIMRVKVGNALQYANVLWDCCASVSLITESKAKQLGLQGIPSDISITVVGGINRAIGSKRYHIPLIDLNGRTFHLEAHSISTISNLCFIAL